jgi:hypothetical protein
MFDPATDTVGSQWKLIYSVIYMGAQEQKGMTRRNPHLRCYPA